MRNWHKNYDPGVPHSINANEYQNIVELLEEAFSQYRSSPCFTQLGKTLNYTEMDFLSQAFAGFLQDECKLNQGDRVAILMPNLLQYPVSLFGILRAKMVVVNVSPLLNEQEIHEVLKRTGAKCVLVLENYAYMIEPAMINTDVKQVIVTQLGDLLPAYKKLAFNFLMRYILKKIPNWKIPDHLLFSQSVKPVFHQRYKKPEIQSEDLAFLQFTEGRSTGLTKCVKVSHRNIVANALQLRYWVDSFFKYNQQGQIIFSIVFFKLSGFTINCIVFLKRGFENRIILNPRDIKSIIKEAKHKPFSMMTAVRAQFTELLNNQAFLKLNFEKLKFVFTAGMAIPKTLEDRWFKCTNSRMVQGYAITECSPIAMMNPFSMRTYGENLGLPLPSTEVKICDEEGLEVPNGMIGEIWIKGPQVSKGYWDHPELTRAKFTSDGWFKSGDIGIMNEEGFVKFIDREEDVIRTSWGRVYPSEVESVILGLAGVSEVVVVGSENHDKKHKIVAFIVKKISTLTEEDIFLHCKKKLVAFQRPESIIFCEKLPMTPTGFVSRRKLREQIKA